MEIFREDYTYDPKKLFWIFSSVDIVVWEGLLQYLLKILIFGIFFVWEQLCMEASLNCKKSSLKTQVKSVMLFLKSSFINDEKRFDQIVVRPELVGGFIYTSNHKEVP